MGRTGVPGEEPAWTRAWLYESLGCFKRQLDRRLGIWASFMVLPLTHYIMFSRPHWDPAFCSSCFDCKNSFKFLFFFFFLILMLFLRSGSNWCIFIADYSRELLQGLYIRDVMEFLWLPWAFLSLLAKCLVKWRFHCHSPIQDHLTTKLGGIIHSLAQQTFCKYLLCVWYRFAVKPFHLPVN